MNFATIHTKMEKMITTLILTVCLVGCGVHNHSGQPVVANNTAIVSPLPYVQPDTTQLVIDGKIKVAPIKAREKNLVKNGVLPPYSTLFKQHIADDSVIRLKDSMMMVKDKRLFRAQDTARHRGHQRDSVFALLKDFSNTQKVSNAEMHSYIKNAGAAQAQNKTASNFNEWEIHLLFAFTIIGRLLYWKHHKQHQPKLA